MLTAMHTEKAPPEASLLGYLAYLFSQTVSKRFL